MKIKIISTPNQKAFGGNLQTKGATWSNGFSYIGNGGSHESNPYEGIQIGIDPQGAPNLVEQGEVVWNDFVFSNRLNLPIKDKNYFKLGGDKSISYADAAYKLAAESEERPNDPISKAGMNKMLTRLAESQETLKERRAQQAAKREFNQMSPEEQLGAMQMAQQQAEQQQAMQQQQGMQDPMAAMGSMSAYGGPINKFDDGGNTLSRRQKRKGYAGKYDPDWFRRRARELGYELPENLAEVFTSSKDGWQQYDRTANLQDFNAWYAKKQREKAENLYKEQAQKKWEEDQISKYYRYKRSDDGKAVYAAKYYDDSYKDKNYIGKDETRITDEEYKKLKEEYEKLREKAAAKRTKEEKDKMKAFEDQSYKKSPLEKGAFLRDYAGDIIYDTDNDVKDTWVQSSGEDFTKGFKWEPTDAAKISYDPDSGYSLLSNLRYAPALGGAIGLINDLASKPDYSRAEEIKKAGAYTAPTINYKPLGNYLRYNPFDINYGLTKLGQESAAARRSIMNTAGTRGAAMAGLLAADYNAQQQYGDTYRKALEYNDTLQQKIEDFNRATDTFNSSQDLKVQMANQNAIQTALKDKYQGIVAGNTLMDSIDARRGASISANLTNTVNSLGQIGEQEWDNNRIQGLINRDVFKDFLKNAEKNTSAYGGMLTKRRKKGGKK